MSKLAKLMATGMSFKVSCPTFYRIGKRVGRWFKCWVLGKHEGPTVARFQWGTRYFVQLCDHCDYYEIIDASAPHEEDE